MEIAIIAIVSLIIGWTMGYYPNRQNVYKDMQQLTNQFANLSTQLMNQLVNSPQQQSMFPPIDGPEVDDPEGRQEKDMDIDDILGGS